MSKKEISISLFPALQPKTQFFNGGRISYIDLLTLDEAAHMASKHAGCEVTSTDFLRSAGRGEIFLIFVVKKEAKFKYLDNLDLDPLIKKGGGWRIPLHACRDLAAKDFAQWRTQEDIVSYKGNYMQYHPIIRLADDEPDFEATSKDCRVLGYHIHALADAYILSTIVDPHASNESALMVASESSTPVPDFSMLATRQQLIDAFGAFTGMNITWFRKIKDSSALLAARKIKGQGGRGHIAEPLFCPLEVMYWLTGNKRRKGRERQKLSEEKGWYLLEKNFPKVYYAHSVADPRNRE